jgi:cytochrome c oxidase subunit 2
MPPNQGYLPNAPLFPMRASEMARDIDLLFFVMLGVLVFFSTLIAALVVYFMVRYRRRSPAQVGTEIHGNTLPLETAWIIIPLIIALTTFAWGARIYFAAARPPSDALQFYVIGKQWMWKVEHPSGKREINELHVPRGEAIKLKMTSEDVIHSFFIPAMRVKTDVIPGRYTTLWFRPDTVGTYHLFCAQYCGAEHSRMVGRVIVMEPTEYELWIGGKGTGSESAGSTGEDLFESKACNTCHRPDTTARAPLLWGLFGKTVALQDGSKVTADETYIRESILNPAAKVVAGYQPIMPTFRGQLSEEEIIQLIRYVQSLKAPVGTVSTAPAPAGVTPEGPAAAPAATSAAPPVEASPETRRIDVGQTQQPPPQPPKGER